jgi:adenylate cyclase
MPPTKKAKWFSYLRWLLLLPIPVVWCLVDQNRLFSFFENKSLDWRFQFRGELASPVKIVHVNIDTPSLYEIGGFPWSRSYFASVTEALVGEAKVKAVGYDIVFSDQGIAESVDRRKLILGNKDFGTYLMKQPPVVLAASYAGQSFLDINGNRKERVLAIVATDPRPPNQIEPPELPSFETSADPAKPRPFTPPVAIGLIDTLGNGTRTAPMWAPNNTNITYFHMAVQLARLYWGLPVGSIKVLSDRLDYVRPDGSLQASVPLIDGQLLEINWFTRWEESPHTLHIEFSDVYKYSEALLSKDPEEQKLGKQFFAQDGFKDAVVLVGPVDRLFQDIAPTSLDNDAVPKVGVHGNLLKTIVTGQFVTRLSDRTNNYIVFGLTIIVATLSLAGGARALFAKIMAVLAVAIYIALAFRVFQGNHLVLPMTAPLGSALTTAFAGLIWQVIEEQKAKGRIQGMFGAYVSPQLVDRMIDSGEDPQLGGHEEEITAYFSDIQSFSSFSEKLPPAKLVDLMNEYLTACTDIVQSQGGTLDKYIGDAVVAMFGAPIPLPDHAFRACVATQLVHQQLGELRKKWKAEGDKWPEIVWKMQSRIGLNSGLVTIGNMGSRTRFNYTMMGDNVNLAARMESGAKAWGAYTMVADATRAACQKQDPERVIFRALGRIQVMGRSQAVPIFEIVGLKEFIAPTAAECIGLFEQGLAKYYAREWDAAVACFEKSAELEPNQPGKTPGVKTNPSLVYIDIVERYKIDPPVADWNGVYVMTEK